jgi:outer membrane protein assembly factor BamB
LIFVPIRMDEYSVRRGYYWTGAIFGLGLYFLLAAIFGAISTEIMKDEIGVTISWFVFGFGWAFNIVPFLLKGIWLRKPPVDGHLPQNYRYRHWVSPVVILLVVGMSVNLYSQNPDQIQYKIPLFLLYLLGGPTLLLSSPINSLLVLLPLTLVGWLVYRLERKSHPYDEGSSLLEPFRKNRKKIIRWMAGVIVWMILFLPVINHSVNGYIISLKEAIRLQQPGEARFYRIYTASIVDNLLFFQGSSYGSTVDCLCIYAVDMNTGRIAWSTETLADEEAGDSVDSSRETHSPSNYNIVGFSADDEIVYVSTNDVYYAFDVDTGQVIWQKPITSFNSFGEYSNGIFLEDGGNLQRVNAKTGNTEWSLDIQDSEVYSISFGEDGLGLVTLWKYVDDLSLSDTFLVLDTRSGRDLWQIDYKGTDQWVTSTSGLLYRIAEDDHPDPFKVYAYDRVTGKEVWVFDQDDAIREFSYLGRVKDQIILSVIDPIEHGAVNRLIGLDSLSGRILWTEDFERASSYVAGDSTGNLAYVKAANSRDITAIDLNSGEKIWKYVSDDDIQEFLQLNDNLVIMTDVNSKGVDAASGALIWQLDRGVLLPDNSPLINVIGEPDRHLRNDVGYSTDETGGLIMVDLATGKDLWRWQSPDEAVTDFTVGEVTDEYVIVYNSDDHDRVFVLSPEGELVFEYLK